MGGLSNSRVATHTNRATNTLRIPKPAATGLAYMKMHNLLSRNPLGSGGVGRIVKNKPCNCNITKTKTGVEDTGALEDTEHFGEPVKEESCNFCYISENISGCSFKSPNSNYYCCPSGNYSNSGCSTSENVCYIDSSDNSGCLANRSFTKCSGGKCVWDGKGDIIDFFTTSGCETVLITSDLTDISQSIVVPLGKTLISYGKISFSKMNDYAIRIFGSATFNETVSFSTINHSVGIQIDGSGNGTFNETVSFSTINGFGIRIVGTGTFNDTVSFSEINIYGIVIGGGSGIFQDICFNHPISSSDAEGIVAYAADISYTNICGTPSGNVWPNKPPKLPDINQCT